MSKLIDICWDGKEQEHYAHWVIDPCTFSAIEEFADFGDSIENEEGRLTTMMYAYNDLDLTIEILDSVFLVELRTDRTLEYLLNHVAFITETYPVMFPILRREPS